MSKTMKYDAIANDASRNMAALPKRVTDIAAYVQIAFLNDAKAPAIKETYAIPERWTRWSGGEMPCHEDAVVEFIAVKNGERLPLQSRRAGNLDWGHAVGMANIIAYDVVAIPAGRHAR